MAVSYATINQYLDRSSWWEEGWFTIRHFFEDGGVQSHDPSLFELLERDETCVLSFQCEQQGTECKQLKEVTTQNDQESTGVDEHLTSTKQTPSAFVDSSAIKDESQSATSENNEHPEAMDSIISVFPDDAQEPRRPNQDAVDIPFPSYSPYGAPPSYTYRLSSPAETTSSLTTISDRSPPPLMEFLSAAVDARKQGPLEKYGEIALRSSVSQIATTGHVGSGSKPEEEDAVGGAEYDGPIETEFVTKSVQGAAMDGHSESPTSPLEHDSASVEPVVDRTNHNSNSSSSRKDEPQEEPSLNALQVVRSIEVDSPGNSMHASDQDESAVFSPGNIQSHDVPNHDETSESTITAAGTNKTATSLITKTTENGDFDSPDELADNSSNFCVSSKSSKQTPPLKLVSKTKRKGVGKKELDNMMRFSPPLKASERSSVNGRLRSATTEPTKRTVTPKNLVKKEKNSAAVKRASLRSSTQSTIEVKSLRDNDSANTPIQTQDEASPLKGKRGTFPLGGRELKELGSQIETTKLRRRTGTNESVQVKIEEETPNLPDSSPAAPNSAKKRKRGFRPVGARELKELGAVEETSETKSARGKNTSKKSAVTGVTESNRSTRGQRQNVQVVIEARPTTKAGSKRKAADNEVPKPTRASKRIKAGKKNSK